MAFGKRVSKLDKYDCEIEAFLAIGSSQKFIANRYGTTETNLKNWIKKHETKKKMANLVPEEPEWDENVEQKAKEHHKSNEIADRFRVNEITESSSGQGGYPLSKYCEVEKEQQKSLSGFSGKVARARVRRDQATIPIMKHFVARRETEITNFKDQEVLGAIADEAYKEFEMALWDAEVSLLSALGIEKDKFFKYEQLLLLVIASAQHLTVEKMLAAGYRQVIL